MKVIVLYHPQSDHARKVETYAQDFQRQRGKTIELVSLETPEGADKARLYDIVQYPAVLALRDDGQLSKLWQSDEMPLMDEVAGYFEA